MRTGMATAALAATLLLAGCLGAPQGEPALDPAELPPVSQPDPATAAPPPAVPDAPPARIETFPFTGRLTLAAGSPDAGYLAPTGAVDEHGFAATLAPGAAAVVVELVWDDALQDLDLQVVPPGCDTTLTACLLADGGAPGQGDRPVRIEVQDEAVLGPGGEWRFTAWAKNAVNASFTIYATVFWGAEPPEGFSAVPA